LPDFCPETRLQPLGGADARELCRAGGNENDALWLGLGTSKKRRVELGRRKFTSVMSVGPLARDCIFISATLPEAWIRGMRSGFDNCRNRV
jgi:hypothetical protein